MQYYVLKTWADAMMISETLQYKKIIPVVIPFDDWRAEIIINEKDLKTAQTICNDWRVKQ